MATSNELQAGVAAANELYWGSDRSVNQIAEELELSKSGLYGMIRPLPLGLACPECSEVVVWANRTARDRGILSCPACAWEGSEDDTSPYGGKGADTLPTYEENDEVPTVRPRFGLGRARTMVGGALLGAAVGLAWVLWARRR